TSMPCSSTSNMRSAPSTMPTVRRPSPFISAKSRARRSNRFAMRGVPRERRDGGRFARHAENAGGTLDDARELGLAVELEAQHDAEAIAQWRRQQPRARRGADQRKRRKIELDRAGGGPLADDDVELVVLHRRIKNLFDDRAQAMDLIDEERVVRLQIREYGGEIAGPLEHRARGVPQAHAHLVRDDVGERRLAESRRPEEEHVIERL